MTPSDMPSITIRKLPEEQLQWLRMRAAEHNRSVNAELLDLLAVLRADELAALETDSPFAKSYRRAKALGVRTPSSSTATVRSDRDRDE
ncbi:MAG: hypothetical protein CL477_20325 [Acidobacteria bacterium]|nr:hypothetical protein [Acidobacteriota bacterium]